MKLYANVLSAVILILSIQSTASAQPEEVEFVIPMTEGWNMISSPVDPENGDMWYVFRDILHRDNFILGKDGLGNFFFPAEDFNCLPDWVVDQGYLVKLSGADTLTIVGEPVDPETPIHLIRGWSMVAYFPEEQVDAITAFSNIEQHLIIAKDGFGNFYMPEFNFNNMTELRQGRGYLVKVREEVELVWNVH